MGSPEIDRLLKNAIPTQTASNANAQQFRWRTLPMQVKDNRIIGHMLIKEPEVDQTALKVIGIFLAQVSAVVQYKLLMRQLEIIANTDGLTGTANRTFFEKAYASNLKNAAQFPEIYFSIMIIDINGLKRINDRYGHEKGDEIITRVAQMLVSLCRETDILARIGGDEFALLLPSVHRQQAEYLLQRIKQEEKRLFLTVRGAQNRPKQIPIRISIGVAGSDETEPEKVMKLADQRMYVDKENYYQTVVQQIYEEQR